MRWAFWHTEPEDPGERARRLHSQWLTKALASGKAYPRIPCRRTDEGGFDPLLRKSNGQQLAERWWSLAFERVDE